MGVSGGITCASVRAHLPLFTGGDLPASDAGVVRAHLQCCHDCQRELACFRAARVALRVGLAEPTLAPGFFSRLQAQTLACVAAAGAPRRGWRRLTVRVGAAVALVLLGLGTAWFALARDGQPGARLLRQPELVQTAPWRPTGGTGDVVVPVSFSPRTQGLRGLQRLNLDPRWGDAPREPR